MPTHSHTLAHARWAAPGSSGWRRLASVIRGGLVLALLLCAVAHGSTQEPQALTSASAASSVMAAEDGQPHGPHSPHGEKECGSDAVARLATQTAECPFDRADTQAFLVAVSPAMGHPLVRRETRRHRIKRTGRMTLVRSSRWRI